MDDGLWEVSIEVPGGFEERDPRRDDRVTLITYYPASEGQEEDVRRRLQTALSPLGSMPRQITVRWCDDQDWVMRAREGMGPIRIGPVCVVPPWYVDRAGGDHELEVIIAPGTAFGTGYHETTRLALGCLVELISREDFHSILDVGCGTGVLAVAALKMGVSEGYGCDIDPAAVACARENAMRNGVIRRLHLCACDAAALPHDTWPMSFPLVVANLTADIISARARTLDMLTAPRGKLVLSGIYCAEVAGIRRAFAGAWDVAAERHEGCWTAMVLQRRS